MTAPRAGPALWPILIAMLLAPPALAQTALSGSVHDSLGNVLSGVEVLVLSAASSVPAAVEHSDARGRFRISDLVPGSYRIAALKRGYSTFVGDVDTIVQSSIDVVLRPASDTRTTPADPEWVLRLPRRGVTREVEPGSVLDPATEAEPTLAAAGAPRVEIRQMFTAGARGSGRDGQNADLAASETALRFATPLGDRANVSVQGHRARAGATAPATADAARQGETALSFDLSYEPSVRDDLDVGIYYGEHDYRLASDLAALADLSQRHRSWGSVASWSRRIDRGGSFGVGFDVRDTALDRPGAALDETPGFSHRAVVARGAYRSDADTRHELQLALGGERLATERAVVDEPLAGGIVEQGWSLRVNVGDTWTAPGSPVAAVYGIEYRKSERNGGPERVIPRVGCRWSDGRWSVGAVVSYHAATGDSLPGPAAPGGAGPLGWEADARVPVAPGVHVRAGYDYLPSAPDRLGYAAGHAVGAGEPLYLTGGDVAVRQQSVTLQEERGAVTTFAEVARGRADGSLATLLPYGIPPIETVPSSLAYHDGRLGVRIPSSGTELVAEYRRVRTESERETYDSAQRSVEVRLRQAVDSRRLPGEWKVLLALRMGSIETAALSEWERHGGDEAAIDAVTQRVSAGIAVLF